MLERNEKGRARVRPVRWLARAPRNYWEPWAPNKGRDIGSPCRPADARLDPTWFACMQPPSVSALCLDGT